MKAVVVLECYSQLRRSEVFLSVFVDLSFGRSCFVVSMFCGSQWTLAVSDVVGLAGIQISPKLGSLLRTGVFIHHKRCTFDACSFS